MNNNDDDFRPNIDRRAKQGTANNSKTQVLKTTSQSAKTNATSSSNSHSHTSSQKSFSSSTVTNGTYNLSSSNTQAQQSNNMGYYSSKYNKNNNGERNPIWMILAIAFVVLIIVVVMLKSCTNSNNTQNDLNSIITDISSENQGENDDSSLPENVISDSSRVETTIASNNKEELTTSITASTPSVNEITIDSIVQKSISIEPINKAETTIEKATIETISGTISSEGQTDTYTFVPPVTGRYRFEISELTKGTGNKVNIRIKNSGGGDEGSTNYGVGNGDGVTIKDMQANEQYTIEIRQYSGIDNYNLSIGYQKETVDVTDVTEVHDSIEYTDQRNVYTFIPSVTGRYRFEIDGLTKGSGNKVNILVFNSGGGDEGSTQYGVGNGDGVTVKDMHAEEKYEIQVRQYSGIDEYTLKIGKQKETIDVSDVTEIHDSIEYTEQRNVYTFVPAVSGRYRFEIADLAKGSGNKVNVLIFNSGGGDEGSTQYGCGNGDGVTVKDMQAEEKYEILICQYSGTDEYTLKVGKQKEEVDISNYSIIKDSIEFTDQRNVYYFTPSRKSNYRFNISGLSNGSGNKVNILVFNSRNGDEGSTQYGVGNDDGITVKDMDPNELYQVQVRYYSGFDNYTLSISEAENE